MTVDQVPETVSPEKRALHYRLLGTEPGEQPLQPRKAARQVLASFLPRAFRRPVEPAEIDQFMVLFDRSAQRGDPYTESMKLALARRAGLAGFPVPHGEAQSRARHPSVEPV